MTNFDLACGSIDRMARFRYALPLLGFLYLPLAAAADNPGNFPQRCQSDDGFLRILSDRDLDPARCKSHIARVLKAYAFVTARSAWKEPSYLTAQPLKFSVLGDPALKVLGYAQ